MKNSDTQLIHSILDGNDAAFEELVKKYQKQVHALVWRKIGDFHIAEEITQDTFLKAYHKLGTLKQPQRFASWLYVIAANRCNTWMRNKYLRKQLFEDKDVTQHEKATYSEYVHSENERITAETQRDVVRKLLEKLEESERTVITLHYFGEMSCPEIGAFLGVSSNTVKSRLHRAKQRLQKEEVIIREALDNFKISPYLTDDIMRDISRLKPVAPSSGKPVVPWAVAASTLVVVLLILGFGNSRYLTRFQEPYNLDANAEMTVDIIDAPIVVNFESKPDIRTQVGSANAQDVINKPKHLPNDSDAKVGEVQSEEITKDYTQWELPKAAKARLGKGGINVLQYSPDGSKLAVGSNIGIWIYDVKTGKEVTMFPGMCQSIAFSHDGRFLVNGGGRYGSGGRFRGKELTLWEVATGQRVSLTGDHLPASELLFSKDGKTLISLGNWGDSINQLDIETKNGNMKMIEERSWEKIKRRSLPEPYALTYDKFAVGLKGGKIELWDTSTGENLSTLNGQIYKLSTFRRLSKRLFGDKQEPRHLREEEHILALEFSPDGGQLAIGSNDTIALLWNTNSNDEPITLRKHTGWINALAFSQDGQMLASGSTDKTIQLWDTTTGEYIRTFTGHNKSISALTFSPDGTTLASGSADGTIRFWNVETGHVLPTHLTGHTEWMKAIAFIEDNNTLVSASVNGIISLWNLKTMLKSDIQTKRNQDFLSGLAFSSDGTKLISLSADGDIFFNKSVATYFGNTRPDGLLRLTDVQTRRELASLVTGGMLDATAFSPDGKTVAFGSFGKVSVWNTETGAVINNPLSDKVQLDKNGALIFPPGVILDDILPLRMIRALVFSPDGKKLVSGSDQGHVEMWSVETGTVITTLSDQTQRESIAALSFSSNGLLLAIGSNKGIRVMGGSKLTLLREFSSSVESLVFAPNSTVLATGIRNGGIEIWDVESGDKLTTLDGHSEPVGTLIFSPDGKTLVSTGQDGTILIWDWDEVLKGTDKKGL